LFPYALGLAVGYHLNGTVSWLPGVLGFVGVVCLGLGIEGFNEYFDSQIGGDSPFALVRQGGLWWHLPLGLGGFALVLVVALLLSALRGWMVLAFALCGGAIALSYLAPPMRLSRRGLGEAAIAIGYGPGLTLGGFYLQTGRLSWEAALVSLLPAASMFAIALANEVPDYYGDRLVGKRNLIVRAGPRRGVILCGAAMALWFGLVVAGLLLGVLPAGLSLTLLLVPIVWRSLRYGLQHCATPVRFVRVIRTMIVVFVVAHVAATAAYVCSSH
jgi:1,4-dihydroxy-2-naphthoate octaprenyltransferase